MDLKLCYQFLTFVILLLGIADGRRRRFHRRGPHMCGTESRLRCCPGWIAAPYSSLCIHKCTHPQCHDHRFNRNQNPFDGEHGMQGDASFKETNSTSSTFTANTNIPVSKKNPNSRRFFRPHISDSSKITHQLPRFGHRTVASVNGPTISRFKKYSRGSLSKWKEYFKSKRSQTKVIRRRYNKNGRPVIIQNREQMMNIQANAEKQFKSTNAVTKTNIRKPVLTPKSFLLNDEMQIKDSPSRVHRNKHQQSNRNKRHRKRNPAGKTGRRKMTRRRWKKPRFVPPIGFQGDQPFLDLTLPEDELILKDLEKSGALNLSDSNSTDITISGSNSTLESLGVICRGDLCLQKERLLNYNFTNMKNLLNPSEVECPKGYFKAVRENIIVCEAYRKSAKRPKKKKKNRKKKKTRTTSVAPPQYFTSTLRTTTTDLQLVTERPEYSGTNNFQDITCPPGQIKSQRGDLTLCLDIAPSTKSPKPDIDPDIYGQTCPRRQRVVYKNGVTFCADENDYGVCDTGQEANEKDGILFCEDNISSKVEIVSKLPPSSPSVTPCTQGEVAVTDESGTICATPPDSNVNTSVESAKKVSVCIDGAEPVMVNGRQICKEPEIFEEILPINAVCPEHYILTRIEGKSVCRRDVLNPKDGICPLRYTLHILEDKPVCIFDYPKSTKEGIAPMNGKCPAGFNIVQSNGREICKSRETTGDFVKPRRGQCPEGYLLISRDRELVCQRDHIYEGASVVLELPEDGMCPLNYKLAFFDDRPVCMKSNGDVLQPIDGSCPKGYVMLSSQEKVICKKEPKTPKDCLRGQQLVEENGRKLCKSIFDLPPDLNCPPGYRTYKGVCEEEELLRILLKSGGVVQCPEGQILIERNSMFFCETMTTIAPIGTTRRGGCSEDQIPVERNGEIVCVPSEERRRKEPSTPGPPVKCSAGERVTVQNGKVFCEQSRGDIDINKEIPEISTIARNDCPNGTRKISVDGRMKCHSTTEVCLPGQKLVLKNDKVFCEMPGGISVQIYVKATPPCPEGSTQVLRNDRIVCRDTQTVPTCPTGEIVVVTKYEIFCELSGQLEFSKEIQITTSGAARDPKCPEGQTKIVKGGKTFCEILGEVDKNQRTKKEQTTTGVVDFGGGRFKDCPKGYTKIPLRDGKFECELRIEPTNRPKEGCPEGYKKILLRGGDFDCEIEDCPKGFSRVDKPDGTYKCDRRSEECPVGHKKVNYSNGQHECELDKCPEGFRKKWAFNRFICEPKRFEQESDLDGEWVDPSLVDCPKGYVRALRDNLLVCQSLRGSVLSGRNVNCSSNEILILEITGPRCEIFRCDADEKLEVQNGIRSCRRVITTTPSPMCPPDMEVVRVESGYICRYIEITTTTIPTTTITCPNKEILVRTETGLRCIKIQMAQPTTTEAPCLSGMKPLQTGVGIICIFEGSQFTSTQQPTSCPEGQILMETSDGRAVCGFQMKELKCNHGQLEIFTIDGEKMCKNIEDLKPDENPCPVGLSPVATISGFQCRYSETRVHEEHDPFCVKGQILTLTQFGFFCEDLVTNGRLPDCGPNQVAVQTELGLECVSNEIASMICEEGHHIAKTDSGYFCEQYQFDVKKECGEGEIMVIFGADRICKKLEHNIELCGKGYKAIRTEEGFVCSNVHLPLQCPDGYHLLTRVDGKPECYPHTDDKPCLERGEPPCENGVRLVPCKPGYNVIDGQEGPECQLGDFIEVVCSEENQCVAESCRTGYGTKTCQDLLQLVLDGCIPQCSNGGTCINKTCQCPNGVTGGSCEEDINECEELPDGYCQYGCRNTFGSFECRCPEGTTLNADKRTCKAIGCIPDCMNNGVCVDGSCMCPRGFNGSMCEIDVDECEKNNGLCEFYCRNTFGSYSCVCPPGSRLREDGRSCMNVTCIPECKNGGRCENHKCLCPEGFYGVICQLDVNECYRDKPCSHRCINMPGSYTCTCPEWARLSRDRHNCQNITTTTIL